MVYAISVEQKTGGDKMKKIYERVSKATGNRVIYYKGMTFVFVKSDEAEKFLKEAKKEKAAIAAYEEEL